MSILLAGAVVWITVVGPVGMAMAAGLGWHCPDLVQIKMHCLCPDLGGVLLPPPLLPLPRPAVGGVQRGLEGIWYCRHCRCCFSGGPTGPSLTLANAPLAREHRGPPIPARHWLPCWPRSTGAPGDKAAQGWGLGPQLGARCRRSPNTCRPVLDTV